MTRPLFRPEALQTHRGGWLGKVSLQPSWSLFWWALGAVLAAASVVVFLAFGEYTRRSRVSGTLIPDLGLSVVVAPVSGFVSRVLPEEGSEVRRGDALVLLSTPRNSADGGDSWATLRTGLQQRRDSLQRSADALTEQLDTRELGLQAQLVAAKTEQAQLQSEISTRMQAVELARDKVERFRSIAAEHHVSAVQLREQELAMLQLLQSQQALQRQATSLEREQLRLTQALAELPAERAAALAQLDAELVKLDMDGVEQDARGERLLNAAVDGLVAQRLVQPGQAVREGDALLIVLPKGSMLQAQLDVPSSAIGFIAPGDQVLLRYHAFPYQKFGHQHGKVLRIARNTLSATTASSVAANPAGTTLGDHYRVLVEIERQHVIAYGQPEALRPGMRVDADILAERRKLYEWLFEPLIAGNAWKPGSP